MTHPEFLENPDMSMRWWLASSSAGKMAGNNWLAEERKIIYSITTCSRWPSRSLLGRQEGTV
jgi:hypothetical protein